jgi:hypothetical protein
VGIEVVSLGRVRQFTALAAAAGIQNVREFANRENSHTLKSLEIWVLVSCSMYIDLDMVSILNDMTLH